MDGGPRVTPDPPTFGARLWTSRSGRAGPSDTARVTIQVPPDELYALADTVHAAAESVAGVPTRLGDGAVGSDLQPAVIGFCEAAVAAATFLAADLDWLGSTIAGVADSWARLDVSLLATAGRAVPQ